MNYTKAKKALIKDGISAQDLRSEINRRQCCQLATMIILKQILAIKIDAILNLLRFRTWYDNLMVASNTNTLHNTYSKTEIVSSYNS